MAKVKTNNEEELLDEVTTAGAANELKTVDEVDVMSEEEKTSRRAREVKTSSGTRKVKIQVTEPVECIIAGTQYSLAKDKAYEVPSDVAAILVTAKRVYRI